MEAEKRIVAIERHEWTLKSPAHHTEIAKAVAVAEAERARIAAHRTRTGDVYVTASDDDVIVSFETERPLARTGVDVDQLSQAAAMKR